LVPAINNLYFVFAKSEQYSFSFLELMISDFLGIVSVVTIK
jgi:hypothetical protein